MRINQNRDRFNQSQLSHEEMRRRCAFMLKQMAKPETADDISRKKQFNVLSDLTRIGVRRVEKLFRGYIPKPSALDFEAIKTTYANWVQARKAQALSEASRMEHEFEELQKAAAHYGAAHRPRVREAGTQAGAVGESATGS